VHTSSAADMSWGCVGSCLTECKSRDVALFPPAMDDRFGNSWGGRTFSHVLSSRRSRWAAMQRPSWSRTSVAQRRPRRTPSTRWSLRSWPSACATRSEKISTTTQFERTKSDTCHASRPAQHHCTTRAWRTCPPSMHKGALRQGSHLASVSRTRIRRLLYCVARWC